jgi:hypothetical protein
MMEPITIKYETYKNPSGQLREKGEEGGEEQDQKERETKQNTIIEKERLIDRNSISLIEWNQNPWLSASSSQESQKTR